MFQRLLNYLLIVYLTMLMLWNKLLEAAPRGTTEHPQDRCYRLCYDGTTDPWHYCAKNCYGRGTSVFNEITRSGCNIM